MENQFSDGGVTVISIYLFWTWIPELQGIFQKYGRPKENK